ncbi:MAG TPA: proteasome accessory factor PafA2 family protein [Streptosporangiaceae bacterium]
MTRDSDFKKLVRQRMAATGQSYTAARAAICRSAADVDLTLVRRAFGLKTSYAAAFDGGHAPSGIGASEYLFNPMVAWGRSTNVFLENGARLCLRPDESGVAQPAYATPECDSIVELVAAERAGDLILARLANRAEAALSREGSPATLAVSGRAAAQSESYLVASAVAPERYLRLLEPFLATRWIYERAVAPQLPQAALAGVSFADESRYRRLKITGADRGLSQLATFLKVGATEQVLRLAESSAEVPAGYGGYIRPIDAVHAQHAYLAAARRIRRRPEDDIILDAWQAALDNREDGQDPAPGSGHWDLRESPGGPVGDIPPVSAAMANLSQAGILIATAAQIETAVDLPPQTTRARLRGLFIKTAKDHRRNFTLDWVHLKLNDTAMRTVRCLDPLDANLEMAERLITSINRVSSAEGLRS